jgi:hypothetical protein
MDELIAFLTACLDEDERVAREADSGRWLPEDKGITFEYRADDFHGGEAQARLVADTRANQWHIASWDPARVLAEVEAKRRILDLHAPINGYDPNGPVCSTCGETGNPGDEMLVVRWPCPTVRLLAQPCAARPGWREEWQVSAPA